MHIMIGHIKVTIKQTYRDCFGATIQYPDGTTYYGEYNSVKDVLEAVENHNKK